MLEWTAVGITRQVIHGSTPRGGNAPNGGQPRSRERVRVGRDNEVSVSVCRRQESK